VTFRNPTDATLYLGGCSHFDYEQRVDGAWLPRGAVTVCVWEGLAEPVPPGGVVIDAIDTSRPGIWRLRYPVGFGCDEAAPLAEANCVALVELTSPARGLFPSSCLDLTESTLSDPTRERGSISPSALASPFLNWLYAGQRVDAARWPKLAAFRERTWLRLSLKARIEEEKAQMGV
jgi:hypothetical protein